ncbi:MAG: hypothetical protein JWM12_360 [Ilumatobacteraceae bacterium]|jgi:hypothetical protein|nr:hypothetical protein [Ilumatobacteraceae bacterium]
MDDAHATDADHSESDMGGCGSLVIMIRTWHDDDGVRVRISHDAPGDPSDLVCRSFDDAVDAVRALLERWERVAR